MKKYHYDYARVTVSLTKETAANLKKEAHANNLTVSGFIRKMFSEWGGNGKKTQKQSS